MEDTKELRDLLTWALKVIRNEFGVGDALAMLDEDCDRFQRALEILGLTWDDVATRW